MLKKINYIITLLLFTNSFSQEIAQPTAAFEFLSKYSNCRDFTISSDQKEIYFTIQSNDEQVSRIACAKKVKEKWSEPKLVPFTSKHRDIEPFLSSDGLKLYFASNRPLHDSISTSKDYDIWYVERKNSNEEWSSPINLGKPVNTSSDEFYPSVAANGNLYFTSEGLDSLGKDDIFCSKWNNNSYSKPENLGVNINSSGYEFNAFVSADEQFLIFTGYGKPDGFGSGDLYISFKDKHGNWELAKNLGENINSKAMDYCPYYDKTTQTLYFTSRRTNVQSLDFKTINEFEKEITKYENGFSRIYKCQIKL